MDLEAISNGLAARFAPGTIGTPTGASAMRASYGQAPNSIPTTPCIVVFPKDGDLVYGSGQVKGQHRLDVCFYLSKSPGDIARVEKQRQKWLGLLLAATHGAMKLGLASAVDKAIPASWEFTELPYAGELYDGIIVHVTVYATDNVSLVP